MITEDQPSFRLWKAVLLHNKLIEVLSVKLNKY